MGRIFPFLILLFLVGLAVYAGFQTYSMVKKTPIVSQPTPVPTQEPQVTLFPSPTPNPGINSYLQTRLLNASSTCVHQLLGQDDANYYLWAICRNPEASISIPVSLKLDLTNHRIPGTGDGYESDLKQIFPESVLSQTIFTDIEVQRQLQSRLD